MSEQQRPKYVLVRIRDLANMAEIINEYIELGYTPMNTPIVETTSLYYKEMILPDTVEPTLEELSTTRAKAMAEQREEKKLFSRDLDGALACIRSMGCVHEGYPTAVYNPDTDVWCVNLSPVIVITVPNTNSSTIVKDAGVIAGAVIENFPGLFVPSE